MTADRVFIDANILFSVAYGSPGLDRLWERAKKGHCVLLASRYVIEEAERNLTTSDQLKNRKACLSDVQIVIEADQSVVCPIGLPPKDMPVLMAAIFAKADYLITGDMVHFGKYFGRSIMGVRIMMARDYVLSKTKP